MSKYYVNSCKSWMWHYVKIVWVWVLAWNYLKNMNHFAVLHLCFNMSPDSVSKESVIQYGEQASVFLYKGTLGQSVNGVRMSSCVEKVANTSMIPNNSHPRQMLQNCTAYVFSYIYMSGKGTMHWTPWNGDWKMWTIIWQGTSSRLHYESCAWYVHNWV